MSKSYKPVRVGLWNSIDAWNSIWNPDYVSHVSENNLTKHIETDNEMRTVTKITVKKKEWRAERQYDEHYDALR